MENGIIWDGAITKITAEYDGRVANQPLKGAPLKFCSQFSNSSS